LLQGPDLVLGVPRVPLVQMEGKPVWVENRIAQQLGLTDHQIVQATVTLNSGSVRLWLKNFSFEIPNTWGLKPGDMPFVRATQNAQGWNIQLTGKSPIPPGEVNLNKAGTLGATALVTPQRFNEQLNLMGVNSGTAAEQNLGSRVGMLLQQQIDFSQSAMLFRPDQLALMANHPALAQWLAAFKKMALNMSHVSSQGLKKMVLSQATSSEHLLASSEEVEESPRSLLHRLLQSLDSTSSEEKVQLKDQVHQALQELESAQAQGAQDWTRGALSLKVVIPFIDADPVDLHFKKPARQQGESETPLSVDIHSKSRLLGEVWLNTTITQGRQVDLVMWAARPEVADLAQLNAKELGFELADSGLQLSSFQIFNVPKPQEVLLETLPKLGTVVDAKA
jgi:hypothetical protein